MKAPTLMKQTRVRIGDVVAQYRLRPVSPAGVAALVSSITETGIMKDAIHVRKHHSGELRLLAGAHRLAAATELGWEEIEAKVWTDVTDDWARLIEIDDNLAGAELNPLDTAVFLATRKAVYEKLHPETKRGMAGANARWGDATDTMSVAFVKATAEKFGFSERHVFRLLAAGSRLGSDEVGKLRSAPRQITLKDLQDIAQIKDAPSRYDVVDALAEGRAKNAAAALKALKPASEATVKDPVEAQFHAIKTAWLRGGKSAQRRFAEEFRAELEELLATGMMGVAAE